MAIRTRVMNIQEFLYAFALGDDGQIGDPAGSAPLMRWTQAGIADSGDGGSVRSVLDHLPLTGESLRAEIERHNDRTMTVVSLEGSETITRCGTCPKEATRPCMALRLLALPYAQHVRYQPEWWVAPPHRFGGAVPNGFGAETQAVIPKQHQRLDDLPPPGNARRRILHQLGISFSRSDFTDDELAQRGIGNETTAGIPGEATP